VAFYRAALRRGNRHRAPLPRGRNTLLYPRTRSASLQAVGCGIRARASCGHDHAAARQSAGERAASSLLWLAWHPALRYAALDVKTPRLTHAAALALRRAKSNAQRFAP